MNDKWRISEDAQLSIDFVIGFTIFMIAFIFVATMMSGLLINLQSQSIDYDAVAYRTGVMLAEDPGEPYFPGYLDRPYWHLLYFPTDRADVERLGLSIGRNVPEILQEAKVERFFNWLPSDDENKDVLYYPDDYRQKIIFGDYPYNFNITLKEIGGDERYWDVGHEPPEAYGYARRAVLIKKPCFADIDVIQDTTTSTILNIHMIIPQLFDPAINPAHTINPIQENVNINLQNFIKVTRLQKIELISIPEDDPTDLSDIFYSSNYPETDPNTIRLYVDDTEYLSPYSVDLTNNTRILIERGFFQKHGFTEEYGEVRFGEILINLTFTKPVSEGNYFEFGNIAHTPLVPAVLEVKIW